MVADETGAPSRFLSPGAQPVSSPRKNLPLVLEFAPRHEEGCQDMSESAIKARSSDLSSQLQSVSFLFLFLSQDHQAQVKQVIPGLVAMDHLLAEDPAVGAPGLSGNEDPEPLWKGAFGAESGPYYSERHQVQYSSRKTLDLVLKRSVVIAVQLRRMGDKWNLRQRILNLIAKLFCPGT
ncbi:hypothetical protein NXF25_007402 [Crotalus adamanteus]|uniref:Uncharacterized protein n=1 Tax=Crotalus adamanteus TaxID=8729 RepID=A0AAW1C3N1_CROAD